MKKILLMFVSVVVATLSIFAQQTTVEGSRFFDNTYVGVSVGGQVGMTDLTDHNNWTVAPTGSLYFGKWITPIFGIELNGDALLHDGFSTRNTFVDATYVGLNARLNLNNVFHHYTGTPDRVEFIPFVGFGWLHSYGNGEYTTHNTPTVNYIGRNAFATKMGVDVAIHLNKQRSCVLNIRPTVEYALVGGHVNGVFPKYNVNNGRVGLEVGFTYKFGHKNSKGDVTHNFTKAYTVKEYDDMVALLSNQVPDTVYVTNEVIKEVEVKVIEEVTNQNYVISSPYFARGKYTLDPTADIILDVLAGEMKKNQCSYTITGYASLEGVETFNKTLSLHRAEVVRDALIERGVDADRLTVVAGGPTDKFGATYIVNRTVVIEHTK
ncbi:MAG: OmpA family protein [Lachnospiraceae bacterium]|nr:OmpA family protein [Lachnospiraceae bacterium]